MRHTYRVSIAVFGVLALLLGVSAAAAAVPSQSLVGTPVQLSTNRSVGIAAVSELTRTIYLPLTASQPPVKASTPMGIQYYGLVGPSSGFDHFRVTQAGWIRVPFSWADIEPADTVSDNYQWSDTLDTTARNVTRSGKEIILTLSEQPAWAAQYPSGPLYNNVYLLEFMSALVERYDGDGVADAPGSPVIKYYELYNEPDNTDPVRAASGGWGYWGNNGSGYAALMKELYPVIKAANPDAQLVFGGIALDWFVKDGGIFNKEFLDDVLDACKGTKCFDYANFHYYPLFYQGWQPNGIASKAAYIREKLDAAGMQDIPIMATELGWVSGEESWGKSDELQARYAVQGYVRGFSADLVAMTWFKFDDSGMNSGPGLLDANRDPKPSYYAFQTTAAMLSGATFGRALTASDTGTTCPIEGYVIWKGPQRVDVLWVNDGTPFDASDDPSCQYTARTSSLTVVDKYGSVTSLSDGDDGANDGAVKVWVGGSPLFLQYP